MTRDSVDVLGRPLHEGVSCIGVYGSTDPASPCGDWVPWENTTTYFRTGAIAIQSPRDRNGTVVTDSFTYDASGNRTKDIKRLPILLTTTLFYPALSNRVDSAQITLAGSGSSTMYYAYYADGSRWQSLSNTVVPDDEYQYDGAGRMVGYAHNDLVVANTCLYDPDGRMYQSCGGLAYSLLGADAIHDATNSWFYVHAPGIDEPLLAIKRVPTTYQAQARLQILSDGTGQLVSIADSSGGFNSLYAGPDHYTPGTWATAGMTSHAQTFDPQRLSADSGAISSFRTRQYDPGTGNWLQEDHGGMAGGVNLYQYNGNDPNSFGDPFGTVPCDEPAGSQQPADSTLTCTYTQSTGQMACTAGSSDTILNVFGYSGAGEYKNKPTAEAIIGKGPIPAGIYNMTPIAGLYENKGRLVIRLTPSAETRMFGRAGMLIHGDNRTHTASEGCIILPPSARKKIASQGGGVLHVQH